MRDPYDILGVKRGATLDEIKTAYRRLSKERHPDLGGTNEAMSELNTAYAFILNDLKQGYQHQQQSESRQQHAGESQETWSDVHEASDDEARRDTTWRNRYREIDEELETLRRYAQQYDEQLKTMRAAAWSTGRRADWAKLTLEDIARFFTRLARSGVKGIAVLFAALVGLGSVLVEANVVSAIIMLGAGLGVFASLALKSDKGGVMSAALLLFGVMTIWLPPVRAALFTFPLATVCVLLLLGLIFKFTQAGGTVGFMTGGVLALFVIAAIVNDTAQRPAAIAIVPPPAPSPTRQPTIETPRPAPAASPSFSAPAPTPTHPTPQQTVALVPPEPRTLLAADGAILKFVAGVPYHLKVRAGMSTSLRTAQGRFVLGSDSGETGSCTEAVDFPKEPAAGPWREVSGMLRACGSDAIVNVVVAQ
jgi:hypothetical protein